MDERLVEAAQALLTGYDTALSRDWRAEDRKWREEDLKWREAERAKMSAELEFMEEQRRWRAADVEQRHLENARVLWARVVERNRRDVEEKSEQLRALANMAALIAGFTLAAFLQFDWSGFVDTTGALLPLFALTMALTVGFDMIAVIICTLMLVSIIKTGQRYMSDEEEAEFMARAREFAASYRPGLRPPAPLRSFAAHWNTRCETSWRRAFALFGLSIPACFGNLTVAAWIKFDDSLPSAIIVTVIMLAAVAAVAWHHRKWTAHILTKEQLALSAERVPLISRGLPFDWHLKPAAIPRQVGGGASPRTGSAGDELSYMSESGGRWQQHPSSAMPP